MILVVQKALFPPFEAIKIIMGGGSEETQGSTAETEEVPVAIEGVEGEKKSTVRLLFRMVIFCSVQCRNDLSLNCHGYHLTPNLVFYAYFERW